MSRDDGCDPERLDRLEMGLAEQERVTDDLDSAVTAQWGEIERLRRAVDGLQGRLAEAERRLPAGPEAPPPHY